MKLPVAFPQEVTTAFIYHQLFWFFSPFVDLLGTADGEVTVSLAVDEEEGAGG
jgi:hypothetical protein